MTRSRLLWHAWLQLGIWIALAVVLNHLAAAWPVRIDVTADQRHSLSPAAIDAVARLKEPLTATVWFTEDLGAPYHNHRQATLDLLAELEASSGGQLDLVIRDPTGDEASKQSAARAGIRPITWAQRDGDQSVARQVWMGVSFDHGTRHTAVDALPRIDRMEHDLVRAILAVTTPVEDRKTVGWLQGNGEPDLGSFAADHPLGRLRSELASRFEVVVVDARAPIPETVDAVVVVGPQLGLSADSRAHLDAFVMDGGALGLFVASVQPDFGQGVVRPVHHELGALVGPWGIAFGPTVIDRTRNEPMVLPMGGQLARVSHPMAPVSTGFDRSYAPVRDLKRAVLPFATALTLSPPAEVEGFVWLSTEGTSRTSTATSLDPKALVEPAADEVAGPHAVVVAAQGSFPSGFLTEGQASSAPTRVVVAGSADMVANNPELVRNAVDWLLSDPRLVGIRSKGSGPAPLSRPANPTVWRAAVGGIPLVLLGLLALVLGRRR